MFSHGNGSSKNSGNGPQDPRVPEMIHELLEDVVIPPLLFGCGYSEAELGAPRIEVDIPNRSIRLDISDDELEKRLAGWKPPQPKYRKGVLSSYSRNVSSGDKGAILS